MRFQRLAPRSYVMGVKTPAPATALSTLSPSATTSGPIPSPPITARLKVRRVCVRRSSPAVVLAWVTGAS